MNEQRLRGGFCHPFVFPGPSAHRPLGRSSRNGAVPVSAPPVGIKIDHTSACLRPLARPVGAAGKRWGRLSQTRKSGPLEAMSDLPLEADAWPVPSFFGRGASGLSQICERVVLRQMETADRSGRAFRTSAAVNRAGRGGSSKYGVPLHEVIANTAKFSQEKK